MVGAIPLPTLNPAKTNAGNQHPRPPLKTLRVSPSTLTGCSCGYTSHDSRVKFINRNRILGPFFTTLGNKNPPIPALIHPSIPPPRIFASPKLASKLTLPTTMLTSCAHGTTNRRQRIFGRGVTTLGSSLDPAEEAGMRARANDRAHKNLGARELNLGSLPEGAKIVNLPNQVWPRLVGWALKLPAVVCLVDRAAA